MNTDCGTWSLNICSKKMGTMCSRLTKMENLQNDFFEGTSIIGCEDYEFDCRHTVLGVMIIHCL